MKNSSNKANPKQVSASTAAISPAPTSDTDDLVLPPSLFEEGEHVIASHSGHYYPAKVEKLKFNQSWRYLIHYTGWNKRCSSGLEHVDHLSNNWDEWVEYDRLLKMTEENLKKVSHDKKQTQHKYAKSGCTSQIKLGCGSDAAGKKEKANSTLIYRKRKREQISNKEKDNEPTERPFNILIPPTLRKQLVDDSEFVNQMGKLVRLPRNPNVDAVIEKYLEYMGKKDGGISASVGEVLSGLCDYFNKALPVMLLYNKERTQYQEAIAEVASQSSPSAVYGAEHLLRLFVKLPGLLNELDIEKAMLRELQQNVHDFLKFLQKNQSVFFLSTYSVAEDSRRSTDKGQE